MKALHELNATSIKKALTSYGVNVLNCYKGKGTTKKATYIVVSTSDLDLALHAFTELGIVNCGGNTHKKMKCSCESFDFGACYMSDSMFNELND